MQCLKQNQDDLAVDNELEPGSKQANMIFDKAWRNKHSNEYE